MVISFADWTLGRNLYLSIANQTVMNRFVTYNTHNFSPPDTDETPGTAYIHCSNNGTDFMGFIFPTGDSIGGHGAEGYNEGTITFWTLFSNYFAGRLIFIFRRISELAADKTLATAELNAYGVRLAKGSLGPGHPAEIIRFNLGTETIIAGGYFPPGWNPFAGYWQQHRIRWFNTDSGALRIYYDNRRNTTENWVNSLVVDDPTNTYQDSTNKIAFYYDQRLSSNHMYMEGINLKQ